MTSMAHLTSKGKKFVLLHLYDSNVLVLLLFGVAVLAVVELSLSAYERYEERVQENLVQLEKLNEKEKLEPNSKEEIS